MALGQKLGKVLGAIGGGLSFIPGPWAAIGVGLSAGGQIASQVGAAKDRREAEREEQQTIQPQNVQQETDNSRAAQGQLPDVPNMQLQPPGRNIRTMQPTSSMTQMDQLRDQAVVQAFLRDGGMYGE